MKSPFALVLALALAVAVPVLAAPAESPLWLRYPAISPDGADRRLQYKGDLWSVPVAGGTARPLTVSESYEYAPVWSHDGRSLAFASDRYGNFDVFVMPVGGGEARRLTFHSAAETPASFTADDKAVLFSATRQDPASNAQFPAGRHERTVPRARGRRPREPGAAGPGARCRASMPRATRLLYHDYKGTENPWRKHHTSSVTRDIWVYDTTAGAYRQLTTNPAEDRDPVFGAGADDYYWLSERGGSFNVYQGSLSDPAKRDGPHDVREAPGALPDPCERRHAVLQLRRRPLHAEAGRPAGEAGGADRHRRARHPGPRGAGERRVHRTGAGAQRQGVRLRLPRRDLRQQRRGRRHQAHHRHALAGAQPRAGAPTGAPWSTPPSWTRAGTSTRRPSRAEEPYFYASTVLKTESVVATEAEEFQPAFSPDGKEIAYLENRVALKVVNLATKRVAPGPAGRPQLLLRRRRPVLPVVAGRQVVPGAVRPAASAS